LFVYNLFYVYTNGEIFYNHQNLQPAHSVLVFNQYIQSFYSFIYPFIHPFIYP